MGRRKGSGDVIPRGHSAKRAFSEAGVDVVAVAAGLLASDEVSPKDKLEMIGKLLPYMFAKAGPRKAVKESEDEPEEIPLSPDEVLRHLDALKGAN